jgi:hypothetical protein
MESKESRRKIRLGAKKTTTRCNFREENSTTLINLMLNKLEQKVAMSMKSTVGH